jgi:hypothetical protein
VFENNADINPNTLFVILGTILEILEKSTTPWSCGARSSKMSGSVLIRFDVSITIGGIMIEIRERKNNTKDEKTSPISIPEELCVFLDTALQGAGNSSQ